MEILDLSNSTYAPELHKGVPTKSIGWLGNKVMKQGPVDGGLLKKLESIRDSNSYFDGDLGTHKCEICYEYEDCGELWIEGNGYRYVLPRMILHYIRVHNYLPPKEFLLVLENYAQN